MKSKPNKQVKKNKMKEKKCHQLEQMLSLYIYIFEKNVEFILFHSK